MCKMFYFGIHDGNGRAAVAAGSDGGRNGMRYLGGPVCSATAAVVVQSIFSISNLRRARSFAHSRATVQSSFSAARSISAGPASCLSLIAFPKWTVRLPSAEKYHGASIFLQKEFQYAIGLGILGTCADCGSARGKGERAECAVLAY